MAFDFPVNNDPDKVQIILCIKNDFRNNYRITSIINNAAYQLFHLYQFFSR